MALIFQGRVGVEHYIDEAGKNATKPAQQFMSGVMIFREEYKGKQMVQEPVLDKDGKAIVDSSGAQTLKAVEKDVLIKMQHSFKPGDIGKPYDKFKDENGILKRYPLAFKKA